MVKRLRKSVRRYSTKYASFLAVSYQTFKMNSVNSGVTGPKFTKFLLYRGIIYAVNVHIEVAISHSILECQSDEKGEFAIISQNWLP